MLPARLRMHPTVRHARRTGAAAGGDAARHVPPRPR
jgi:hypothetical protein